MDTEIILTIVLTVLTIIAALLGDRYQKAKSKASLVTKLLSQLVAAGEDDTVSEAEFQAILATVKDITE